MSDREYRVAVSGPYVVAHTRTVTAKDEAQAERRALRDANLSGLDILYAAAKVVAR